MLNWYKYDPIGVVVTAIIVALSILLAVNVVDVRGQAAVFTTTIINLT